MRIKESGEMYLETILVLQKAKGEVRSIDIANELNYSKASVSRAMGILKNEGFVTIDSNGHIHFTESGSRRANNVYERHRVLTNYFISTLELDKETAETEACRVEHVISDELFAKIKEFVNKK